MFKSLFARNDRLKPLLLILALAFAGLLGTYVVAEHSVLPAQSSNALPSLEELQQRADTGDAEAQNELGLIYRDGERGVQQSYEQAAAWFKKAADQGWSRAQNSLGVLHEEGKGVPQDAAKAMELYRKAAETGLPDAQANMGRMYQIGTAVTPEIVKAVEWYTRAAEQGNAPAQFNLANLYRDGRGVTQSYEQAAKWYAKAADDNNFGPAQVNLASLYFDGSGVQKDYAKAGHYYRLAEKNGETRVSEFLDKVTSKCQASSGSVESNDVPDCMVAAGAGNAKAQSIIGALYDSGTYLPQNRGEALTWYEKAAFGGHRSAQMMLFVHYGKEGEHSPEALIKSYAWLLLLEQHESADARFRAMAQKLPVVKEKYESRMTREDIDEAIALSKRYAAQIEINTKDGAIR